MKRITLFALALSVFSLASCDYTPEAITSSEPTFGVTPPADPVIVGTGSHKEGKKTYYDIWVCNADGSNKKNVLSNTTGGFGQVRWSASTNELIWDEPFTITKGKNNNARTIGLVNKKKGTVSVVNGAPTLSNITTLVPAISGTDTFYYGAASWSSVSSVYEIAIPRYRTGFNSYPQKDTLVIINASTGTASYLWTCVDTAQIKALAWSPDGNTLAVSTVTGSGPTRTMDIDLVEKSSGSLVANVISDWLIASVQDWSRTGESKLLFIGQQFQLSPPTHSYLLDLNDNTITELPSANFYDYRYCAFSPDNSQILKPNYPIGEGATIYTLSSGSASSILSTGIPTDWKR